MGWQDAPEVQGAPAWASAPEVGAPKKKAGINDRGGFLQNLAGSVLSGAGDIGATILSPVDAAARALNDGKPVNIGGYDIVGQDRRAGIESGLKTAGVDTDATEFTLGRVGTQILGTLGVGGAVAKGLTTAAPTIANAAPSVIQAIRTGGFSANGAKGFTGLATRTLGGSVTGAASAGFVNPEDMEEGAAIGAVVPGLVQGVGKAANAVGRTLRGPEVAPDVLAAVQRARDLNYVIPPTQAKPTLVNRLLEGFAGKLTTAQNASAKNANVTNTLAAKALGLADDVKLTPEVLEDVRKSAGVVYRDVSSLPIKPAQAAQPLSNLPAKAEINPKDLVFDLRKARNDATAWYTSYGRTADPESLAKAQAAKALASELEGTLETYAKSLGRDDLVAEMVKARQLIAKTYSVEKALNGTTGNVDAKKLAQQLAKGKPLTGELKDAAEFAARFPKAAQTVEGMGSLPQTSPLDWAASGAISAGMSNPLYLAAAAARPVARASILSGPMQNRLARPQTPNQLMELLSSPEGQQFIYRAAPTAITSR